MITVIDSSESGHGKIDTRWQDNGTFHDGLDRGTEFTPMMPESQLATHGVRLPIQSITTSKNVLW